METTKRAYSKSSSARGVAIVGSPTEVGMHKPRLIYRDYFGKAIDYEALIEDAERVGAEMEGRAFEQRNVDAATSALWADRAKRHHVNGGAPARKQSLMESIAETVAATVGVAMKHARVDKRLVDLEARLRALENKR